MKAGSLILVTVILLLVICSVLIHKNYRQALTRQAQRTDLIRSNVFESPYGSIEYLLEGEGPVLLISHGVTGGIDQGIGLASMYLGSGYRCLYISRFGYLKSTMPSHPSASLQAEAYNDLLDHLGIDSIFIVGNSAGGASAIQFALNHPERTRGLILISSVVPGNKKPLPPKPFMKAVFGSDFLYWVTIRLFGRNMMRMFVPRSVERQLPEPQVKKLIHQVMMSSLPVTKRNRGILFDIYQSNPLVNEGIPFEKIRTPALIIHAEDDPAPPFEGARTMAERMPSGELAGFKTGGHLLLGHEDEIKRVIHTFISRHKNEACIY